MKKDVLTMCLQMLSDQGAKRIAKIWFCAEKRRTDEKDLAASKAYADVDEIIGATFWVVWQQVT